MRVLIVFQSLSSEVIDDVQTRRARGDRLQFVEPMLMVVEGRRAEQISDVEHLLLDQQ